MPLNIWTARDYCICVHVINTHSSASIVCFVHIIDSHMILFSSSGYDFGYLLKLLTNEKLPEDEGDFYDRLTCYFPKIYDVKYLMKSCKNLKGGLQEVADQLKVSTLGLMISDSVQHVY